jgi:ribosome biogenesis GTPase / thiamine phosphate phosphatase
LSTESSIGLVVAAHGRHLIVEAPDRSRCLCHLRGKKTEAVVGDRVRWSDSGDEGVVEALEPRRNLMYRQDEWRSKAFAANLDQVLVLVAGEPVFSESQLARALVAAAQAGIPGIVGLNKTDLPSAAAARERLAPYRAMGTPVLDGRTTLVLGPSGAGKSTLINRRVPAAEAQVGEISQALGTGRHTTTSTRWYWIGPGPHDGALIDSPGFQAFGLHHVAAANLAALMPDLAPHLGGCRFYNCTHRHEPGCALRAAADAGEIAASRWRIYGEIFDELSSPKHF